MLEHLTEPLATLKNAEKILETNEYYFKNNYLYVIELLNKYEYDEIYVLNSKSKEQKFFCEIYEEFSERNRLNDIWGDFNIIFASSFYGYKLIDLPVRYHERKAGETKMKKRVYYFFNMLNLCWIALVTFKFVYRDSN